MLENEIINKFKNSLFEINSPESFNELALSIFKFQASHNPVYKQYISFLDVDPLKVTSIDKIPFLPIAFFKSHKVLIETSKPVEVIFESSGTTGEITSKHYLNDTDLYKKVSKTIFNKYYGNLSDYVILALLPSYLERGNSSLVYMVDYFIKESGSKESGFYLNNLSDLVSKIKLLKDKQKKVILIGVTFALIDLAEKFNVDFSSIEIMETGGMKGRKKEMVRDEAHSLLKNKFNVNSIHSEYGMTELISQAYSYKDGIFNCPPWMKILIRDINDPFTYNKAQKSGGTNIIDLANISSCSFIETKDIGQLFEDDSFKILGRFDNADIRGCNLMVSDF